MRVRSPLPAPLFMHHVSHLYVARLPGSVAQWQSRGLITPWLQVRILSDPLHFLLLHKFFLLQKFDRNRATASSTIILERTRYMKRGMFHGLEVEAKPDHQRILHHGPAQPQHREDENEGEKENAGGGQHRRRPFTAPTRLETRLPDHGQLIAALTRACQQTPS